MFLVVDKDANPSTAVPHNEIKNSDVEDVITVEVNNKHEIGHRLLRQITSQLLSLHFYRFVMFFKLFRMAIFWTATIKAPMVITKK